MSFCAPAFLDLHIVSAKFHCVAHQQIGQPWPFSKEGLSLSGLTSAACSVKDVGFAVASCSGLHGLDHKARQNPCPYDSG
jgi:hypothetical protein